jgi:hypothetical protein
MAVISTFAALGLWDLGCGHPYRVIAGSLAETCVLENQDRRSDAWFDVVHGGGHSVLRRQLLALSSLLGSFFSQIRFVQDDRGRLSTLRPSIRVN